MIVLQLKVFVIIYLFIPKLSTYAFKSTNETLNYRLPETIWPKRYEINIEMEKDVFSTEKFKGIVIIYLEIPPQEDKKTNEIKLHKSHMEIESITFQKNNTTIIDYTDRSYNNVTEIYTINFEKPLDFGYYKLQLNYTGNLIKDEMSGFYLSTYSVNNNDLNMLATTQFESTSARKAFPCFDEPKFKARFQISIQYPTTDNFNIISNSALGSEVEISPGLKKKTFKETPKMSTYTVAFVFSQFTSTVSAADNSINIWSKPGSESKRSIALEQTPKLVNALNDYTRISYKDMGIDKLDIAAIPDFAAGAMENWGLITFREIYILDDAEDTSNFIKNRITTTIAHELAHQYFGNYLTMEWWSDTWLNEGFATYFEYMISHVVNPLHELDIQFITTSQQIVFQIDALLSALPLSSNESVINTPVEIDNKFSLISYEKGGSVIRMMNNFIGSDNFQTGLRQYLANNSYQPVRPQHLWTELDTVWRDLNLNKSISEVMDSWINKPGFPFVTVSINQDNKVTLTQEQFVDATSREATNWYIPIAYTTKKNVTDDVSARTWLLPAAVLILDDMLTADEWIIINNEAAGYFRVKYEDQLLEKIKNALNQTDFDKISVKNRVQLIDDIFNLARIGKVKYTQAFDFAKYLVKEGNYHVWTSAFNCFSFLLQRTGTSVLGQKISEILLSNMKQLIEENPINVTVKDYIKSVNQAQAQKWACDLGDKTCTDTAKILFSDFQGSNKKILPDLRSVVYCSALRNSANITKDWNFLWDNFANASSSEQNVILTALGCTKDVPTLQNYLAMSIDSASGIRKQDGFYAFRAVYNGNPEGVDVALQFLIDNHQNISAYYKGSSGSSILTGLADKFTTQSQIDKLQAFLDSAETADEFKIVGEQALEAARTNIQWLKTFQSELNKIFGIKDGTGGGAASIGVGISFLLTLILSLKNFM